MAAAVAAAAAAAVVAGAAAGAAAAAAAAAVGAAGFLPVGTSVTEHDDVTHVRLWLRRRRGAAAVVAMASSSSTYICKIYVVLRIAVSPLLALGSLERQSDDKGVTDIE